MSSPRRTRIPAFSARLIAWQRRHGRHDLPWQGTRDAFRIWVSEIMLQQTQVAAVIPYYRRFLERFPDVAALAAAGEEDVLAQWSGLGYYARARNLHRAAREVLARHAGRFPTRYEALAQLPGVGRSTAAAIAALAAGERRAILDGNVKRVLARHAGIGGDPSKAPVLAALWAEADKRLPDRAIEAYTQGLMDLGAGVCLARAPLCQACPVRSDCVAARAGRIAELPGRKARRASPLREIAMLVVVSRGQVLLVKRPSAGTWGGLWSLPEIGGAEDPAAALRRDFGLRAARVEELPAFEHAFTHFKLAVTPWKIRIEGSDHSIARAHGREAPPPGSMEWSDPIIWMPLADVAGAALPAPVKKLLSRSGSAGAGTCAGSPAAPKRRATRGASASRRS